MRFALSREQRDFSSSIAAMLADSDTPAAIRAWAGGKHEPGLALWRQLAELGVTALAVPERYDGIGAGTVDLVVALEQIGYHAVPGPIAESLAAVPALLAELGETDLAASRLPALASGTSIATLKTPPAVPHALDADIAELRLCLDGDAVLEFPRPDGAPLTSIDPARRLFDVPGGNTTRLATAAAATERALLLGTLACAAQLVGAGQWLLDSSVDYAKNRVQYGKPIGQYQAVKHMLADVATELELARPLLHGAAVAVDSGTDTVRRDVSAAKVSAADAAYRAARTALQVHGAIGYTAEHATGLWLTRVRALHGAWGTQAWHRARVLGELAGTGR
ncbi:acyl-CoA dehydrogenase family protein [Haloechinothrix sp. LS1_15]|uniref:acyl-CoA dehydrogenase family protein n=1 Tax=Haloechinothrix sp. LS1_15 TaxID=2652248 RepID=UPI002944514D|nr:acyl-CoA dehydrogenase family protein [Haloechinothrix sp. LS1_15]MDV6014170.1 acyl-CoA dehydrogenase [Haloechinothrix sp. LS1_15]